MEVTTKRKAVDEAFRRMFGYEWGTQFGLDDESNQHELVQIFGVARAARIIGNKNASVKRRKVDGTEAARKQLIDYKTLELPPTAATIASSASENKGTQPQTQTQAKSKIDSVLEQLAGPSKTSTVKKTSDDWEAFKESDKQLQDELEKQAQGKDAYLVKKDFLTRVDNRKFELEKEERDKERAKRVMPS